MLSENDLRELAEFNAQAPVLSLYLNTDPSMGNADAHKKRARRETRTRFAARWG